MDEDLRSALEKLAVELTTPVARSRDEWVRGNNAGTTTAGKRLQELLDKFPPATVTVRTYGYEQPGKPVVGSWDSAADADAAVKEQRIIAELVTRQVSTTPWVSVNAGAAPKGLAHLPLR